MGAVLVEGPAVSETEGRIGAGPGSSTFKPDVPAGFEVVEDSAPPSVGGPLVCEFARPPASKDLNRGSTSPSRLMFE